MKRTPKQLVKNYLMLLVGAAVYALAFDGCFVPNDIAFGGITGLAQIVNFFLPWAPIGVLVILFNVPLFLLGWKLLGGHMLVSSLAAMAVSSALIDLFAAWVEFPPMEDTLLACIFGGAVLGVGLGIVFLQGATTGGTEIVAMLLKLKLAWLPVGKLLLGADLVVVAAVALVFRRIDTLYFHLDNGLGTLRYGQRQGCLYHFRQTRGDRPGHHGRPGSDGNLPPGGGGIPGPAQEGDPLCL